jgi:hypothetical protein
MHVRRKLLLRVTALAATLTLIGGIGVATAGEDPQPVDFTHNGVDAPAPVAGSVFGTGPATKTGTAICTTATSTAPNVNTDCESTAGPHNETSIAVNPTNHNNMIGGANDYQLGLNPGGHVTESILSRAHVTFDGGRTWSEYPIFSNSAYQATGDPAVAFDVDGHAYYATLGFRFVGPANAQNPDVLVGNSGDGGKTWSTSVVGHGSGVETSVGDLLDKEYVAAWGHGNAIVTFGDFRLLQKGAFFSGTIHAVVTHDGGKTWTAPTVISGSLDQAFVSTPTITADGRIFVSFLNTSYLDPNSVDFTRDDYEVVQVSPATGAPLGAPVKVAKAFDGNCDFPIALGRTTYQDSVFRSWAAGNITADPTDANHLAVVWYDMRNTPGIPFSTCNLLQGQVANPYAVTTNSDPIVSESFDGGQTWSAATAIPLPGDQFQGWSAFDASGKLRIGTFDRSYDTANHMYGYSLLTETTPGTFSKTQVSTVLSNPTTGDRWFARTVNPSFPNATAFLGDYSGIAVVPGTTSVVAYWTDMREDATFAGATRKGEDAFFALIP